MKRNRIVSCAVIVISSILILSGCKKAIDCLQAHPDEGLALCQIRKFSYAGSPLGVGRQINDTMAFTYNAFGDPVTGIRPNPGTGYPNFFFRYDAHHRFTDLVGAYSKTPFEGGGGIESWNKYFYDAANRIVLDSFYFFPEIINGEPDVGKHGNVDIITYEYDVNNRIIKASLVEFGLLIFSDIYSYDIQGNRTGDSYDDKINIHRTNKIWMFLDRDYSVNNPVTASYSYNQFGLPTRIEPFVGTVMRFMSVSETGLEYSKADIEYSCR